MAVARYRVGGDSAAAAANAAYAQFWSPTRRASVRRLSFVSTAATAAVKIQLFKSTARGTASTTTTPTAAANQINGTDQAPTVLLDLAWSVQPTLAAIPLFEWEFNNVSGSGYFEPEDLDAETEVPSGTGLVIQNAGGAAGPVLRVNFDWAE